MKYKGRITATILIVLFSLSLRVYGNIYYDYPYDKFPFITLGIAPVFWWLGKQYDVVRFYSEKDYLTKIYNRRYIFHKFPKLSALIDRKNEKLTLFFIDINNFKMINDNNGHEVGDEVLKHLSNILVRTTRKSDIVARLAGDEFIIITPFIEKNGMNGIVNRINNELIKISEELNFDISVSIGTSVYPNDAKTLDGLLHIADQNMYKQKSLKATN